MSNTCPLTGLEVGPTCSLSSCLHNQAGSCAFTAMLPLEGDLEATASFFSVPVESITRRVTSIKLALVAAEWFEHINGKTVMYAKLQDFRAAQDPKQQSEFQDWNKSEFGFGPVIASLSTLASRL